VGKLDEQKPLGRHKVSRKNNIKTDLHELGCGTNLNYIAQDRDKWWALVKAVVNPQLP
jgi:hypothetical protein